MIIWGTKAVYRKLGYVADYCQLCIAPRSFSLERIGMAGHVYYISAGDGDLVGYQRVCSHCNNVFGADPEHYASFAKQTKPVPELIKETYPNFATAHKERLVLESHIRKAPLALPDDLRRQLIMEPFLLLSPKLNDYYKTTQLALGGSFIKNDIVPTLGATLARLHPSEDEVQAVLTRLTQLKHQIGNKVKLGALMADINARLSGDLERRPGARPARYGGSALDPVQKAARVFRLLSYVQIAVCVITSLSVFSAKTGAGISPPAEVWLLCIAFGALAAGLYVLGTAISKHKNWGRIVGIIAGVAMLIGFPIGTIVGAYILWQLVKGWEEGAPQSTFA